VAASVQRYTDIPKEIRDTLQRRMEKRQYDEVVSITRDSISGEHEYTDLRDMHFGNGKICRQVSRTKWKEGAVERGLIYCEEGHCIIVPTVCNNVSRVTRLKRMAPPPETVSQGAGAPPATAAQAPIFLLASPSIEPVKSGPSFVELKQPPLVSLEEQPRFFSHSPYVPIIWDGPFFPPIVTPFPPPPPPPPIPEPSTWLLFLAGASLLLLKRK
jgi:hypothetical protein